MTERVVAAALYIDLPCDKGVGWDGKLDQIILTLPPPARHHTLIPAGYIMKGNKAVCSYEQGFITSTGRYVNRFEAMKIAKAANQPFVNEESRALSDMLFSEDLW